MRSRPSCNCSDFAMSNASVTQKEPVYIIIPVHNRKQITLKCLENLKQCGDLQRYYTVVVDDGSTDGTSEAIDALYPEVTILSGDGNLWWTGAIKKGMEYAYQQGAEYFIWLNDDCLVIPNTLKKLVTFCSDNLNSIIGCQGVNQHNHEQIDFGGKIRKWGNYIMINCPNGKILECDMLSGNLVCIAQAVIKKIGFPQPDLVPHYGGDSLFLILARKAKFKIFVDSRDEIFNISGESKVAPQHWLLQDGKPDEIIKLFFAPYSLYSWRVWLTLNREEYGILLGTLSFMIYYGIRFAIPITLITILRFLPLSLRYQLSDIKRKLIIY